MINPSAFQLDGVYVWAYTECVPVDMIGKYAFVIRFRKATVVRIDSLIMIMALDLRSFIIKRKTLKVGNLQSSQEPTRSQPKDTG